MIYLTFLSLPTCPISPLNVTPAISRRSPTPPLLPSSLPPLLPSSLCSWNRSRVRPFLTALLTMATPTVTAAEYTQGRAIKRVSGEADGNGQNASTTSSGEQTHKTTAEKISELAVDESSDPDALPEGFQYPSGSKFWLLMFNLGAVIILGAIDMSIVATAVPAITDHFHTVADIGWYSIAFRLAQCACQFLYVSENEGRKSNPSNLSETTANLHPSIQVWQSVQALFHQARVFACKWLFFPGLAALCDGRLVFHAYSRASCGWSRYCWS